MLGHFGWQVELGPEGVSATTRQEKAVQSLTTQVREYFVKTGVFEVLDEAVAASERVERDGDRQSPMRVRACVSSKRVSSHSRASTPRGTLSPRVPSHPSLPKARPLTAPSSTRSDSALPALHPGCGGGHFMVGVVGPRRASFAGAAVGGGSRGGGCRLPPPRADAGMERITSGSASKVVSPVPSPASTPHFYVSGWPSVFAEPGHVEGGPAGTPPASASRDGSSHGPPLHSSYAHGRTLSAPHVSGAAASPQSHHDVFVQIPQQQQLLPMDPCMAYTTMPVASGGTQIPETAPGGTSLSDIGAAAVHHRVFHTPPHSTQHPAASVMTPAWQSTSPANTTFHLNMSPAVQLSPYAHQTPVSLHRPSHIPPAAVAHPPMGPHFPNQESRAPSPRPPDRIAMALLGGGSSLDRSIEFLPNGATVGAGGSSFGAMLDSSDGRS
jgi:hypothetical protein